MGPTWRARSPSAARSSSRQRAEFKLFLPYKAPFILGHDLAGVVIRVDSAVTLHRG
jgi:NADPH:quinone reductase-like Zn-dependent oxidoreductase